MTTDTRPPTKILYCIDKLLRGGTELQLIGLIERLDPALYQPYLLTIRPSDPSLVPANCIALSWDVPKLFCWSGLKALFSLIQFLRREHIDIVQTFFQDSTVFGGLAAFIAGTRVRLACFRDLGFWLTPKQKKVLPFIYRRMTGFICNAHMVRDHFSHIFNIPLERMTVIGNGVEASALRFIQHTGPCQHIGIVGNMTRPVKRTDLFIKAAAMVAKTHPDIQWHILGDGHLRTELEQLAEDSGIRGKLQFAGRIDRIPEYLERLDIGVICSDSEGLSNALIEYMFKGVTAIATAVGGNPELIAHEKTGLLIPPNDAQALADALNHLIEDNDLRHHLALQAREKAEQAFNWPSCLQYHHHFYQHQLGR